MFAVLREGFNSQSKIHLRVSLNNTAKQVNGRIWWPPLPNFKYHKVNGVQEKRRFSENVRKTKMFSTSEEQISTGDKITYYMWIKMSYT